MGYLETACRQGSICHTSKLGTVSSLTQPDVTPAAVEKGLVCGRNMTTTPENYYHAEYQGHTIYFCTEAFLESFKADPDRFYLAHSRKKDQRQK